MPRMRTLKPSFFSNDQLAELPPVGRLLFQGLWCMADREGRLEDRPKRIKAEVLPYDTVNVDRLLTALAERGFILRYESDGTRYIQVVNFKKHQNPHVNEAQSTIPAPSEHGATPVPPPNGHSTAPSSRARVPGHGIQLQEQELDILTAPSAPTENGNEPAFSTSDQERVDAANAVLAPIGLSADQRFWRKALSTCGDLDLEAEAICMADWLRRHKKRVCSTGFVLNWLKGSAERQTSKVTPIRGSPYTVEMAALEFAHLTDANAS